jgi:hypothetical protein
VSGPTAVALGFGIGDFVSCIILAVTLSVTRYQLKELKGKRHE